MSVAFCVAVRGCGRGCGTKTATQNATLTLVWNDLYYQLLGYHNNSGESEHGPDGEDGGDGDHGGDPGPERGHHLRAGGGEGGGERLTPGALGPAGALLGNVEGKQQSQMATLNTDTCGYV